jgi:ABC-type transporter Mla subunit MlaD
MKKDKEKVAVVVEEGKVLKDIKADIIKVLEDTVSYISRDDLAVAIRGIIGAPDLKKEIDFFSHIQDQVTASMEIIAKERDQLESIQSKLESFLDSANYGLENLGNAVRELQYAGNAARDLQYAIDSLSEQL